MNCSDFNIKIVYTGDIHGRFLYDEINKSVGASRLGGYVSDLRTSRKNILLVDTGDLLHGETMVTTSRGDAAVRLFNLIGYDYLVPGNHDFNYGYQRLIKLSRAMKAKVLAANIIFSNGKFLFKQNDTVKIDGKRIGIFGLTTPETAIKTNPKNIEGITFLDPVRVADEQVKKLREKEVDLIIAITHLGVDNESFGHRSYDVRDKVLGIDLIIDGHSHTELKKIRQTPAAAQIVSAGAYLEYVGVVGISIINGQKIITPKSIHFDDLKSQRPDMALEKVIVNISKKIAHLLDKIVGESRVYLEGKKSAVRTRETHLTKIITDAVLKETGADLVFLNGGSFRSSINSGSITMNDVLSVSPFNNFIVTKKIKGLNILKMLEWGLDKYPSPTGSFPQISGMYCAFDDKAKAGRRVKIIRIGDLPIDYTKEYTVATNDFIAHGGDGYKVVKDSLEAGEYSGLNEIVANYLPSISPITRDDLPPRIVCIARLNKM
ncbi:MAG: bifunctional metallophosphatase/5'-nucleotidase [Oscillospiraceae bacterium]|nr:bifunctional metallophosphatase/5'-nucleotidase [Oscillospiraceae bacterium]